ncbi:PQQ-dependent sugar dehydrogenase [Oceanobacter sp. 5_MG-2023]|uniref:PQQ-dependent sugar dehydrogenase n=1 Tax=Oceanobacter sp. 5_MG-2023 TaxID=3062645 RepID=UPI0026E1B7B1|nr:PQQ-dependent sugar dehydrogenase [Oceanobacter sp. 5_MG-2023]MDO6683200.1 PQQ-dependent sugar dehydrogenase [Oceanobacter sp. 5_MG-2023]
MAASPIRRSTTTLIPGQSGIFPGLLTATLRLLLISGCANSALAADPLPAPQSFTPSPLAVIHSQQGSFIPEVIISGLNHPWAMDFIDANTLLISERSGQLRIARHTIQDGQPQYLLSPAIAGVPEVSTGGQGGLLDVAWHDGQVYFSYAEPGNLMTNSTAVMRATLVDDGHHRYHLTQQTVLFRQAPKYVSRSHFGSRLTFDPQGYLYITLGERYFPRDEAQNLDNHLGKIIRLNADGTTPADNPFVDQAGVRAEIWSYGHRNPQGAAINPNSGELWIHEHGPKGGDELNLIMPGRNYGWPVITYGKEYVGGSIGEGTHKEGMEQPLYYWVPSIAPSGMAFYSGEVFPDWQGDVFIGSLKFRQLVRLELDGKQVIAEERLDIPGLDQRIRDVTQGPDGWLYLITDDDNGKLIRLRPISES